MFLANSNPAILFLRITRIVSIYVHEGLIVDIDNDTYTFLRLILIWLDGRFFICKKINMRTSTLFVDAFFLRIYQTVDLRT